MSIMVNALMSVKPVRPSAILLDFVKPVKTQPTKLSMEIVFLKLLILAKMATITTRTWSVFLMPVPLLSPTAAVPNALTLPFSWLMEHASP